MTWTTDNPTERPEACSTIKGSLMRIVFLLRTVAMFSSARVEVTITPDVVYGHKSGLAMTFDVFTPPENANGSGVLFMVNGGW